MKVIWSNSFKRSSQDGQFLEMTILLINIGSHDQVY